MSIKPSSAVCLLLLGAASGCNQSEAATTRPSHNETVPIVGGQKSETETYAAEIKLAGECKAGAECAVEVTLVPKDRYHTNDQYPYKFKTADPPAEGVTYPKPLLTRADGAFEAKRGYFKVPFTAAKAGKATVAGTLHLSVCSEANCFMDRVPLDVAVDVK